MRFDHVEFPSRKFHASRAPFVETHAIYTTRREMSPKILLLALSRSHRRRHRIYTRDISRHQTGDISCIFVLSLSHRRQHKTALLHRKSKRQSKWSTAAVSGRLFGAKNSFLKGDLDDCLLVARSSKT